MAHFGDMLGLQHAIQSRVPGGVRVHTEYTEPELMDAIRIQVLSLLDEAHEALGEAGWKPWAFSNHLNLDAFKSELIDALRFWMNLAIIAGMSEDDVYNGLLASIRKTEARIEHGYGGVKEKCPACKRAYDDPNTGCRACPSPGTIPESEDVAWCSVYGYVTPDGKEWSRVRETEGTTSTA